MTVQELRDLLNWAADDDQVFIETDDENSPDAPYRVHATTLVLELQAQDKRAPAGAITDVHRKVVIR